MSSECKAAVGRREFLKTTGAASVVALGLTDRTLGASASPIIIVADKANGNIGSPPVQWAISELRQAIESRRSPVKVVASVDESNDAALYIAVAEDHSPLWRRFGRGSGLHGAPEAFCLRSGTLEGKPAVLASGSDHKGFVYALLELADRARLNADFPASLTSGAVVNEHPANQVRSVCRAFVSKEDKAWYYDRNFWRKYLSELVAHRFNRFSLAFGIGYDFPRGVTDDYFHFLYPYLFAVPGYKVRVVPLSNAERDRNLEMLKFITDETAKRGLDCQIGIWTHAYQWVDSPRAEHQVEGLTAETHAAYCRDALALLLKSCPAIQGITLRVHGESGVPEGSYSFWQTVFEGASGSGRPVEIDMHAKGIDFRMIDVALKTGMPVKVSPKYWAEHMGLPYHQADIRELEMPRPDEKNQGVFELSNGSRRFMRYGYGDLFQKDRRYGVLFRIWPGTQRMLLWGDPVIAAGYGRRSSFCGASGVEIFEPLFFKGRQGSGLPGGRCAYQDESLEPKDGDWSKYRYTYRVWGRRLYNPDADPDQWRRYLRSEFTRAAGSVEQAASHASRILPLVTTSHLPSAANNSYWPEMYTNMPIIEGSELEPYSDTPKPKRFGTVSPIDPELFLTIEQHAAELLDGQTTGKYSPIEVASWLEDMTEAANGALTAACRSAGRPYTPEFRRFDEDIRIQIALGQFFAAKFRSGTLYDIYMRTGDRSALRQAVDFYRKARTVWSAMADRAGGVYRRDVTYGSAPVRRGHWLDRLPAIDKDLAAMEALITSAPTGPNGNELKAKQAVLASTGRPRRPFVLCTHTPPKFFRPGEPVSMTLSIPAAAAGTKVSEIRLHYRHVNQAERWQVTDLRRTNDQTYTGAIPESYSKSAYNLQYYFELRHGARLAWLHPGFDKELANQPYFLIEAA